MSIPSIPGSTTAQGYEQSIPLYSVNSSAGRIIHTVPGRAVDRIRSTAIGTEIEITKPLDQSSPLLFSQVCGEPAIPEVKISVCRTTSDGLISYWQYVLSNVLVSEYRLFCDEDGVISELITLNYTNIEVSFIPYDSSNQPESPLRAAANVGCQPSLETHIRRQIQAKTPEGFNLFVATVYGEAGGVYYGREAAWQAVGSVIMNRIQTGVWWRRKTSDDVIKHTGFDAYYNVNKVDWDHLKFFDASYLKKHPKLMHGPAGHQQFLKAWATLKNQQINHQDAMTKDEQELLYKMRTVLSNVYKGQVITPANYYYSPRAMDGKQPGFLSYLEKPEKYQVSVPGVREYDFKFYYISAHAERAARKK